ncbi:uncharacterized protein RBU33_021734 [Hipposideros larvatus]
MHGEMEGCIGERMKDRPRTVKKELRVSGAKPWSRQFQRHHCQLRLVQVSDKLLNPSMPRTVYKRGWEAYTRKAPAAQPANSATSIHSQGWRLIQILSNISRTSRPHLWLYDRLWRAISTEELVWKPRYCCILSSLGPRERTAVGRRRLEDSPGRPTARRLVHGAAPDLKSS